MSFRVLAVQRDNQWILDPSDQLHTRQVRSSFRAALTGFISNFAELEKRHALQPESQPNTRPTERLLRLLDSCGGEVLDQLKGNFAVLAVRAETGQLWARRDRLGAHSLYFARQAKGTGWVVGNSAADVFRASGHRFEEDPEYLAGFFSLGGHAPEGHSSFRQVQALLAGELLAIQGQRVHRTRSPIAISERPTWSSEAEAVERFRELLQTSVANCLAPSSDTAVMLSGGMDSGPVAVIADRICQSRNRRLIPISWILRDFPEADESQWIDQVAQELSAPLMRLESGTTLPFSNLAASPVNPEAPFFNAFRPLINQCYQTAAAHGCRVILNGNAGDDLYPAFPLLYRGYIANREWQYLFDDLIESFRRGGWRAVWMKPPLRELLKQPLRRARRRRPRSWLTKDAQRHWIALDTWPPECRQHPVPEFAEQLYGRRMVSGRAQEYFRSCDLGVERRDPYHNEELVAFMLNAPFSFSFRHHRTKWIMREAMKGRLPERIRLKRRTGLMTSFYRAGKASNHKAIVSFLFEQHPEWQRWVKAGAVHAALNDPLNADGRALLIDRCIGYVNWLRYWQAG